MGMKTTLELPDDLYRATKARAAAENRRVKDVIAEALSHSLKNQSRKNAAGPSPESVESTLKALDAIEKGPPPQHDRLIHLMREASGRRKAGWNKADFGEL